MNTPLACREQLLSDLDESVSSACKFLRDADEDLFDGYQCARGVLSHLVFWHREYCSIAYALLLGQKPLLRTGSMAELNQEAEIEFQTLTMAELADSLLELQRELNSTLRQLEDWAVNFPFKKGCRRLDVAGRVEFITHHLHHHLGRQRRAFERGEAWIKAYYPDPS